MISAAKPAIDFDHHSADYVKRWPELVQELHRLPFPIAWSEHHGGFWVLGSWAEGKHVAENWQAFSSDNDIEHERRGGRGVVIPQAPYPLVLTESDPPLSTERRRIEMPFFAPKALREWDIVAHRYLDEAIDRVIERGSADLVHDVVIPTTARTTLHILGFDPDNWRDAALSAHRASYTNPGDADFPLEEMSRLRNMFVEMLAERRVRPRGDLISALAQGKVQGRPLSDAEGQSMMSALVFGGFDTTTSAVLHALVWLDRHRAHQQTLLENDALMVNAVEEFLRYFPPTPGVGRTVMQDMQIGGVPVSAGERVYVWFNAANRDPGKFERADELWLDRPNAKEHLSFSAGGHRCLGSPLAKLEIRVMLATILRRMPDYRIEPQGLASYPRFSSIFGYSKVPISFSPGKPACGTAAPRDATMHH
jgi:cytochrome P450